MVSVPFDHIPIEVAPGFRCDDGSIIICNTNNGGQYRTSTAEAEARELAAVGQFRVASIRAFIGDLDQAEAGFRRSSQLYGELAGAYAGLNAGYEWGKVTGSNVQPSGIAGGLQGGYNWQNGSFVFGGETDIQVSGADDTFAPYKFSNPWFGTLRGRAGYAFNNILFYGTLGLAYGKRAFHGSAELTTPTIFIPGPTGRS